ncbi:hypothetical protein Pint_24509 [Pistacia integerrima]|uniref:Uncharacterized protein n=1 Tax=Pistacia integerrima TaxID=434235 RepID=A0ACC0YDB6_9ROSI|nr:hypothetical protein Pint_24509 [Pistacia integerrima]
MEEEEDATISRIVTDLEETLNQNPTSPISHSTLLDLQSLLNTNDPDLIFRFFDQLPSRNLSISSLITPISSVMDGGPTNLSLLGSKVYLSLLLSPNSPVFTLFTPMAFLSLLRSIRRALKHPQLVSNGGPQVTVTRKRKSGGRARASKNITRSSDEFNQDDSEYDGRTLFIVLEKLESAMSLIYLNRFPDSLKSLIQMVAEIPVLSLELGGYSGLTDLCSRILSRLLRREHGDVASTAAEVLKSLTPLILMGKSQARTFALGFLRGKMMAAARESEGVKKAVLNLPKYLANKAPEKAELRGLAVEAIIEIVKAMEFEDQVAFVEYTLKMSQGQANLRLIAVDLILILMMSLRDPLSVDLDGAVEDSWGLSCLEALIWRCSDSSAAIRARALSNLAQLVGDFISNENNKEVLKKVMGFREGEMNSLLRKRCMDEKAAVRKAALLLVTKLTGLFGGSVDGILLKTLGMSCSDPLVSIRKAAISAISEAFRTFSDESVTAEWLHSVPRLITDNETSIQEECEKLFLELVLDRVSRAGSSGSTLHDSNVKEKSIEREIELLFPEGALGLLKEICNGEVTPWVKKICTSLGKKKRLKPKISIALQNIIRSSESVWLSHSMPIEKWTAPPGAWLLLSEVSAYLPKAVDWEFLHHHWQLLDKYEAGGEFKSPLTLRDEQEDEEGIVSNSVSWAGDRVSLLQTISNVSVELPPEPAADLAHNLLKRIEGFNMHSTEVNAHVKALRTLCKRKASNAEESDILVLKWVRQLLSKASQILEKYISENSEENKNSSFFTPPKHSRKGKKAVAMSISLSEAVTAVYTIGSLVIVCPTADMSSIVPLLYTIITSGNSGPKLNKLPGSSVSVKQIAPSLYIQAWLTMGKLCLADGKLAKSYIPLFVQV